MPCMIQNDLIILCIIGNPKILIMEIWESFVSSDILVPRPPAKIIFQ